MKKTLDAIGLACPIPVVMANKEIEGGAEEFDIIVDNDIAVENLKKAADYNGFDIKVSEDGDNFRLAFTKLEKSEAPKEKEAAPEVKPQVPAGNGYMIFMGNNVIGTGDEELGTNLARMFFFSLSEEENLPKTIAFMNNGVKLATHDEQVIESLKKLKDKGVKILVCGTCLDFYGLKEDLKVGEVSNMYEIQQEIINASNSIIL